MTRVAAHDLVWGPLYALGGSDGEEELASFIDAWRQWHYVAQAVVEVGKSWGEPAADDGHTTLLYGGDARPCWWVRSGGPLDGDGIAASMWGQEGWVDVARPGGGRVRECAQLHVDGLTVDALTAWVRGEAERLGGAARQPSVSAPDLPDHPVASGAPFALPASASRVVLHYLLTQKVLERLAVALRGVSVGGELELTPRIWPHHFDLASLFVGDRDGDGAMTRTIGVGLTPPDGVESSGYWYVSPWAEAGGGAGGGGGASFVRAALPVGRWHERGDAAPMAVLPVPEVWALSGGLEDAHAAAVESAALAGFVSAAFNACAAAGFAREVAG